MFQIYGFVHALAYVAILAENLSSLRARICMGGDADLLPFPLNSYAQLEKEREYRHGNGLNTRALLSTTRTPQASTTTRQRTRLQVGRCTIVSRARHPWVGDASCGTSIGTRSRRTQRSVRRTTGTLFAHS